MVLWGKLSRTRLYVSVNQTTSTPKDVKHILKSLGDAVVINGEPWFVTLHAIRL
ncbi:hypothetical protein GCM10009037_31150 [Halarchaeum grantii]|uniref:Uncharacterized protein n=1 Tax=Halarchaeum grantii TaxID=1193105 RepID=A0A830EYU5_9EURY|nr:hypothetical protein GCM10009037_31150 [Halarchaeum grantii]